MQLQTNILIMGLKVPGIKIDRKLFLRKEFQTKFPREIIDDAVEHNPLHAGIPTDAVDKIADEVIKFERNCVSGISAALGMPRGVATIQCGNYEYSDSLLGC